MILLFPSSDIAGSNVRNVKSFREHDATESVDSSERFLIEETNESTNKVIHQINQCEN